MQTVSGGKGSETAQLVIIMKPETVHKVVDVITRNWALPVSAALGIPLTDMLITSRGVSGMRDVK